jgi:hypothetical protein
MYIGFPGLPLANLSTKTTTATPQLQNSSRADQEQSMNLLAMKRSKQLPITADGSAIAAATKRSGSGLIVHQLLPFS